MFSTHTVSSSQTKASLIPVATVTVFRTPAAVSTAYIAATTIFVTVPANSSIVTPVPIRPGTVTNFRKNIVAPTNVNHGNAQV